MSKTGHGPRRSPQLVLALDPVMPKTLADCPTTRPCPHTRCRYHVQSMDVSDLPGRPWKPNSMRPMSRLENRLQLIARLQQRRLDPARASCTFDGPRTSDGIVHVTRHTAREIAARLGVSIRQARRIARKALLKVARHPDGKDVLLSWAMLNRHK